MPVEAQLEFPGGLRDSLAESILDCRSVLPSIWAGKVELGQDGSGPSAGRLEWALTWLEEGDGFVHSYCNTVPAPDGGTHKAAEERLRRRNPRDTSRKSVSRKLRLPGKLTDCGSAIEPR